MLRLEGEPINHIDEQDIEKQQMLGAFDIYQIAATKSAIYPDKGWPGGLVYCALKLNGEAGELAEHVGKAMRDDAFMVRETLTYERREAIVKEVGDVLWYLSAICNELGIKLNEAAVINLRKLADRQARGTQRGSGDDR